MNRPLMNDNCAETKQLELDFVAKHQLTPYNPAEHVRKLNTVIVSRSLGTSYVWRDEDRQLSVEDLRPFAEYGHTLGLDYQIMYVRNFALDLDCLCRVNSGTASHLNETLLQRIITTVNDTLKQLLELSNSKPLQYSVWRRGCGFHLYYELQVSMETHLMIGRVLSSQYATNSVIIEVPSIMPLPYSAKEPRAPYVPFLPTQQESLLSSKYDDMYHMLFEYTQVFANALSCAKITTRTGDWYCNRVNKCKRKFGELTIPYIKSITILPGHEFMEALVKHINHIILYTKTEVSDDLNLTNDNLVELLEDPTLCDRFTTFMANFNKKFVEIDAITYDTFVNYASMSHTGLYLQHYVVLLHKSLEPINDQKMRNLLRRMFAGVGDPVVNRFIDYYDSRTLNCYSDTAQEMLNHLHFLYVNNVSPFDSISDQLDKLMRSMLCEESSQSFRMSLKESDAEQRKLAIMRAVKAYCKIAVEMRIVMYNVSSSNYYVLSDLGTHYKISAKQENYPTIFNWIGNVKSLRDLVFGEMEIIRSKFSVNQTILLSRCTFQISTTTGVFNSVIGLYTAKSRFLRFLCYRDTAIWELGIDRVMYPEQNQNLIKRYKTVTPHVEMLFDDITPLFVNFILAPAFIQLRRIHHIEEHQIKSLIGLLTRYKSLESAHFLIEYFPIDPKFIFLIMYIYKTYDGFSTLERYQTMSDHIFRIYNNDRVDHDSWTDKFQPIIDEMSYEQRETHLDTLLTIDHPDVNQVSEDFCLYATLLAVSFIKCKSYATLCSAFKMTELPAPRTEHPEYVKDFCWDTSLAAAWTNLHRAIRISFPGEHDDFENNLIMSMFAICMSTFFDPEIVKELLVCISAIFLSNNVLKKCFLMYGPSGTGKSFLSDLIQMLASPKVGRYTSLHEAMDRANVTLKNNVVIINEMKHIDGDKIKAVTGNDAESTKQFYTQEYEMHTNQSLVYGATNSVINFKGNAFIDHVSVRRFHALKLCGQQMPSDFKSVSMFNMMTNSQLYSGTMKPIECEITNLAVGVGWLSFVSYMLYRDENLYPKINVDTLSNRDYCEMLYRTNNRLYDFLVSNGIVVAQGFHMRSERFVHKVKAAIQSAKNNTTTVACPFTSFHDFKQRFESFGTTLELDGTVHDFQEVGLVHHIRRNMSVTECNNSVITSDDITERTVVYTDTVDRENAESYFARENKRYYMHEEGVYRGIEFTQVTISYEHNLSDTPSIAKTNILDDNV